MIDLFDATEWAPAPFIGMTVKLDRDIDRAKPCHDNTVILHQGKHPHGAELRCAVCNAHRGWAPKEMVAFLNQITRSFAAPAGDLPIIWRQQEADMAKEYDNTNKGALFRNDDKREGDEKERDYSGTLNIEGTEYWISGWVKTSKKGMRYLSLAAKPKEETQKASATEMNDSIPF
jgi:hypothetical protein